MSRYATLSDDFYVNLNLNTEMELPGSRETILRPRRLGADVRSIPKIRMDSLMLATATFGLQVGTEDLNQACTVTVVSRTGRSNRNGTAKSLARVGDDPSARNKMALPNG